MSGRQGLSLHPVAERLVLLSGTLSTQVSRIAVSLRCDTQVCLWGSVENRLRLSPASSQPLFDWLRYEVT